uniref:Transcription factor RF2a n=1 Tax=Lilium regale TaxID=82328 RepID=A0A649UAE6_LILRE|nr:transcription factor RF2a [Lilium regale]
MTQLPPKSPTAITMPVNHSHLLPPPTADPSWTDFLDFSSMRRGSHRRSVSDSVAFLECVEIDDDCDNDQEFEFNILDEEKITSMFKSEVEPPSSSATIPASTAQQNYSKEEKQMGGHTNDRQSSCKTETQELAQPSAETDSMVVDPKRVKRIIANRQSAQRSRVRKLQYISELERSVTTLQTEVSALSPQVAFLDHQRSILTAGNGHLKQRIAALAQDKIFKDAHQEALKEEIERLRHVYHQQNMKNMAAPEPAICEALLS